ncbi:MAG: ATP-binding cassette domain-containing protein [Blastocatellia bacterium]|nr:ATP-binding cassette domain-containing protein [Blastocatellia bacterium]
MEGLMSNTTAHHESHEQHPTPFARLRAMLWEDRSDLTVFVIYTIFSGILALAVPLAVQGLVNTIAANLFTQPLVVLTLMVFGGLLFAGCIKLLKLALVEVLQQRIFARVALQLAQQLPRIKESALGEEYAPELVNRFFDVLTIQKTFAKLMLDGWTAVLQVILGLVVMAFYSPVLLAFDVVLLVFVGFNIGVLGIGGLRTSIKESKEKYRVAEWLEEIGRCHTSFKMDGLAGYLVHRADKMVVNYIQARRSHFRVTFRQAIGNQLFQATAGAGILAIGGWLVINRQLTLGQLVAAELIVSGVLTALDKLMKQLEDMYDLLTGIDKVGHVTDLPMEREGGREVPSRSEGATVTCRSVHFSYANRIPILTGLNLQIESGERISLVGASGAGKSTLASLLCGMQEPTHGTVEVNGVDVRDADLESLRIIVALVGDANEIFEGTIEENLVVGRDVSHEDIRWALEMTQLTNDLVHFPQGIKSRLVSSGRNLSRGQMQRLLIARAIVDRPQLLILDEAFTGIDEKTKLRMLDSFYAPENKWTIIDISHDPEVVTRSKKVHVLAGGKIVESGAPEELIARKEGEFSDLFPYLAVNFCKL